MAIDITLLLGDQPGELARIGEVLGRAGVNIEGLCAVTSGGGQAEVHVLVEDLEAALPVMSTAGLAISAEQEVRSCRPGRPARRPRRGEPPTRRRRCEHLPGLPGH